MSDSMRPRDDDPVPPCMDFERPGPHRFGLSRCIECGAEASGGDYSALVKEWRETARVFKSKGGDVCAEISEHYLECANRLQLAIIANPPSQSKEGR